jgi:hypothetical protein
MPTLNVQIQPDRDPGLDVHAALALMSSAAEMAGAELEVTEGEDAGPYVNCFYRAADLGRLWETLRNHVLGEPALGDRIAAASIVTCEGREGWDDFLLLHHFDRRHALDELPSR